MASDNHRQVMEIFHRACELAGSERSLFLDRECHGDAALRQRVEKLLEHDESPAIELETRKLGRDVPALLEPLVGLAGSGIIAPRDLEALLIETPDRSRPRDVETLAKFLLAKKKLTRFQAAVVSKGKQEQLVLGDYVLLEKIGSGGMGTVFRARHRRMKRVVALKLLASSLTRKADSVKRFYREVEAAAKLDHPNIVTAYDAGADRGLHYLVMEHVEGDDLRRLVEEEGSLGVARAVDCVLQAARGLEYAHGEGVVHRDIKPANLLLDSRGTIKILDMGLARFTEDVRPLDGTDGDLTQSGLILGTLDYMAPEQGVSTRNADHRSDVYSLGCTFYYLLIGRAPYEGETVLDKLLAHREAEIPSLEPARGAEGLEDVFRRMAAKRPEDRFQSMTEVIEALGGARASAETASTVGTRAVATAARLRRLPNARSRRVATAGKVTAKRISRDIAKRPPRSKLAWVALGLGILAVGLSLTLARVPIIGWLVVVAVAGLACLLSLFGRGAAVRAASAFVSGLAAIVIGTIVHLPGCVEYTGDLWKKGERFVEVEWDLFEAAENWRPPAVDAAESDVLPPTVAPFRRQAVDRVAELGRFGLDDLTGFGVTYKSTDETIEAYAFRVLESAAVEGYLGRIRQKLSNATFTSGAFSAGEIGPTYGRGDRRTYRAGASTPSGAIDVWWSGNWLYVLLATGEEDTSQFLSRLLRAVDTAAKDG